MLQKKLTNKSGDYSRDTTMMGRSTEIHTTGAYNNTTSKTQTIWQPRCKDCLFCTNKFELAKTNLEHLQQMAKIFQIQAKFYEYRAIMEILYNRSTHVVCVFKENMIYDEPNEFLTQILTKEQACVWVSWHAQFADMVLHDHDM